MYYVNTLHVIVYMFVIFKDNTCVEWPDLSSLHDFLLKPPGYKNKTVRLSLKRGIRNQGMVKSGME